MDKVSEEKMPEPKDDGASRSGLHPPDIIGLRPAVIGVFVLLRCRSCTNSFEGYQPTVAGVAIGKYQCPGCQCFYEVMPEDFEAALDKFMPALSFDEMVGLTEEATRIAETWHQKEPMAALLTYKGINLGELTERYLLSYITLGLQQTPPSDEDQA